MTNVGSKIFTIKPDMYRPVRSIYDSRGKLIGYQKMGVETIGDCDLKDRYPKTGFKKFIRYWVLRNKYEIIWNY